MTFESMFKNDEMQGPIYTVSQLNASASELLSSGFGLIWLVGEVSSFTKASSGHYYLSLKDSQAVARAVMFKARQAFCEFEPEVGDQVQVQARVGLYEPRGDFQLNIQRLRRAGKGTLNEQFERLKAKLQAEGLFDASSKRAVASMPKAIGVITSLGAAALHDVLTSFRRRAPHVRVVIYPSLVQGQTAPLALRQALAKANERAEVDTLLLVRGGGSLEDLWAFNDESLARDIATSLIPVICGVGHESDFTIADFAADIRAATPTAAAEISCLARTVLQSEVDRRMGALSDRMERLFERLDQRLDRLTYRLVSPSERLAARGHQLSLVAQRLRFARPNIVALKQSCDQVSERLRLSFSARLNALNVRLDNLQAHLTALSPEGPLQRGYAIVRGPNGKVLSDCNQVALGDQVQISLAAGHIAAQVTDLKMDHNND